jgi:5-methylcytosine-specific restriction endonuclease McrA
VPTAHSDEVFAAHDRGDVLLRPVLLLNRLYVPICTVTVRRAMVLLYSGAAQALDEEGQMHDFWRWSLLPVRHGDDRLPLVASALRVPRVLHLLHYDRLPQVAVRLTRQNLLRRDQEQCQYCGCRPGPRNLNLDHVRPRSRGGTDSWENLVISCRACNLKKGHRTPDEAGMALIRRPQRPGWSTTALILMGLGRPFSEWEPFLKAG